MKNKTRLAITAAIVLIAIACNPLLKTVDYSVDAGEGEAVKIAFLSDFHGSLYGNGQREIINEIKNAETDIVVFGGDLFDEKHSDENSWTIVDALAGEYTCFYAIGNHEIKTGKADYYKEEMARRGVTVLSGDSKTIEINGRKIRFFGADNISQALKQKEECKDSEYNVLIYHYPAEFPKLSGSFDLILSGHAHGGQWRFPPFINGLYSPEEGLFPKYAGGRYDENGSVMIVSRGLYRHLSNFILPRIFNRPELVFITLKE